MLDETYHNNKFEPVTTRYPNLFDDPGSADIIFYCSEIRAVCIYIVCYTSEQ